MAEAGSGEVSRQEFSVAYDGKGRGDDHTIDVNTLAPALLAFGRLLKEGNLAFNGKKATAKVLVVSDFEHKCFNINFDLVLSYYEQIKSLLGTDTVKTAKEVLEWIGLLGLGAGGQMSYLKYLEWKSGRDVIEERSEVDPAGSIKVTIKGDNNTVHVHPVVLSLSKNPKALRATKDAFLPLGKDGFDQVRITDDGESIQIEPEEIDRIVASCNEGIESSKEELEPEVEITPAWLSVYSPVYDVTADKWRFRLGRDVIYADISATKIAEEAMERGGALSDDAYQVSLEVTTPFDPQGKPKAPVYKIVDVLRFVPGSPAVQQSLFQPKSGDADDL
jgi:hypothetical protein